jgi:hypothetical protein
VLLRYFSLWIASHSNSCSFLSAARGHGKKTLAVAIPQGAAETWEVQAVRNPASGPPGKRAKRACPLPCPRSYHRLLVSWSPVAARKSSNGSERQGRSWMRDFPRGPPRRRDALGSTLVQEIWTVILHQGFVSQPNLASHSRLTLISKLEQTQLQFGDVPGFLPRKRSESAVTQTPLGRCAATLFPGGPDFPGGPVCRKTPRPSPPSDCSPLPFTQAGAFPPCLNRATQRFRGEQSVPRHPA